MYHIPVFLRLVLCILKKYFFFKIAIKTFIIVISLPRRLIQDCEFSYVCGLFKPMTRMFLGNKQSIHRRLSHTLRIFAIINTFINFCNKLFNVFDGLKYQCMYKSSARAANLYVPTSNHMVF